MKAYNPKIYIDDSILDDEHPDLLLKAAWEEGYDGIGLILKTNRSVKDYWIAFSDIVIINDELIKSRY